MKSPFCNFQEDANVRAAELDVDWKEHALSNQELADYGPFMDALKKLVHYPRLSGFTGKPSKIELMVKEVYDKIEAEYKGDWEVYDRIQTTKREAVMAAHAAARNAQVELSVATQGKQMQWSSIVSW
jgi:hypothetical protein